MNEPFILTPTPKDYLWGGNRLNEDYNKNIDMNPLAETWECSTHPDGESFAYGRKLSEILKDHPEYVGSHPQLKNGQLPILIKFIDAKQNLSVQVHPDDEYAEKHEGQLGKTEMWYVLEARDDANIIYGLKRNFNKKDFKSLIESGNIEKYLNKVPVHKDDVFLIQAGTVHAIGEGCLIAEIQENSNLTYRIYDYNRTDKNGKKRELHINKALDVANLQYYESIKRPLRVLNYKPGYASEQLCRCKYFEVHRILVNTEKTKNLPTFQTSSLSFNVFLCTAGCGSLFFNDKALNFFKGDCIFVPANSLKISMHGRFQMLKVNC